MKTLKELDPKDIEDIVKKEEEKEARRNEAKYFLTFAAWILLGAVVVGSITAFILLCLGVFS